MNHPEVFIIPVLMLSDYFLTVWGAILSEKKYAQHFKIEHYELNPLWQKNIARKQWFNMKHLALVAIFTVFCLAWSIAWTSIETGFEVLLGYFTILYVGIIGTHLTNILIFSYLIRHPGSIAGEIKMNHPLMLYMSLFRLLGLLLVLTVIAIFSPTPFILGGLGSQIALSIVKFVWIAKANAAERKKTMPPVL
jgi:hypothetical protein